MTRNYFATLALSLLIFCLGSGVPAKAQDVDFYKLSQEQKSDGILEFCPPYALVEQTPVDLREPFLPYQLTVNDVGGRVEITVVADELHITKEVVGSLVKRPNAADPKISSIIFDARKIILDDNISFRDASATFLAEEVVLNEGGQITILPNSSSYIKIIAEKLRFSERRFRHFDVRQREQFGGDADKFDDIKKLLSVAAEAIHVGNAIISEKEEQLNVLNDRFSLSILVDFRPKIEVTSGPDAHEIWVSDTMNLGRWPSYSASVWQSAFRIAPFDQCLRDKIIATTDSYIPVFQDVADASTNFKVNAISIAAKSGADLQGNGPAWSTNLPLSQLISKIKGYSIGGSGNELRQIDFYLALLEASATKTPVPSDIHSAQLGSLSTDIQNQIAEYDTNTNRLTEIETSLDTSLARLDDLREQYRVREARLMAHAEDLVKGQQDRAKIISGLATAASIVSTAYTGNPTTGAAVGGVIVAIGNGGSGSDAWSSISAGIQFANSISGPLSSLSSSIAEFRKNRKLYDSFIQSFSIGNITIKEQVEVPVENPKPGDPTTKTVTRDDALKQLAGTAKKFSEGVNGVYDTYKEFVPEPSPISEVLEEDKSLKRIAEEIIEQLEEIKEITIELEVLQRTVSEQQLVIVASTEELHSLLNLEVTNEFDRREMTRLAISGVREEFSKFVNLVDLVRRVSILEYRQPLAISTRDVRNIFVSEQLIDDFDPAKSLDNVDVAQQYIGLIQSKRDYVALLAQHIVSAAERQFIGYVEARGRAPSVVLPTVELINNRSARPEVKEFFTVLNDLLDQQFLALADHGLLSNLYERRIHIPFRISDKLDARFPTRLLQVAITEVDHSGKISGGDVVFTIDVDRAGNLRQDQSIIPLSSLVFPNEAEGETCQTRKVTINCFSVDLRSKNIPLRHHFTPYEYTIGQIKSGDSLKRTSPPSYWYLTDADSAPDNGRTMMISYPPAESRMYLRVRLSRNTSWRNAPRIERMTIVAEAFQ